MHAVCRICCFLISLGKWANSCSTCWLSKIQLSNYPPAKDRNTSYGIQSTYQLVTQGREHLAFRKGGGDKNRICGSLYGDMWLKVRDRQRALEHGNRWSVKAGQLRFKMRHNGISGWTPVCCDAEEGTAWWGRLLYLPTSKLRVVTDRWCDLSWVSYKHHLISSSPCIALAKPFIYTNMCAQ